MLPVTYLRSSSIKSFQKCPLRFWSEYGLGLRSTSISPASIRGSAFHSAMYVLATAKQKTQTSKPPYDIFDPETEFVARFNDLSEVNPQDVLQYMMNYYIKDIPLDIMPKSYRNLSAWIRINEIVKYYDRACNLRPNPLNVLNMDIWGAELKFKMPITADWAKYDFTHCGKHYVGQLRLEGSIDLIYNDPHMGYTILDWKSGVVDKSQSDDDLYMDYCNDMQLKMYYLAARRFFRVPVRQMTICQVNVGKSFTVVPSDDDGVLEDIRKIYEQMKAMNVPQRKYTNVCFQHCPMIRQQCGDYQSKPKIKTRTYVRQMDDGSVVEAPMSACMQLNNYFQAGNSREHIENTLCRHEFDIDKYQNS